MAPIPGVPFSDFLEMFKISLEEIRPDASKFLLLEVKTASSRSRNGVRSGYCIFAPPLVGACGASGQNGGGRIERAAIEPDFAGLTPDAGACLGRLVLAGD